MGGGMFDQQDVSERGQDVEGDIMVTLEEATKGSVRTVTMDRTVGCDACQGTGQRAGHVCNVCGGAGRVRKRENFQVRIPPVFLRAKNLGFLAGAKQASAVRLRATFFSG